MEIGHDFRHIATPTVANLVLSLQATYVPLHYNAFNSVAIDVSLTNSKKKFLANRLPLP